MSKAQCNGEVATNAGGSYELPEGWAETAISEVFTLNPRKVPADALESDAPVTFVPMPAVDADSGAITRFETREFSAVRKGYTSFLENDVIVAKITPCMENGKAAIARGLTNGHGFGSSEFHVLRSTGSALPEYVYYFVRQEAFRSEAQSHMTGSVGQKRVPPSFLGKSMLPLPPFAEQERIVAKVEALLERVGKASDRLARVPDLLRRFRQSVLAAACSGQLTADWREDGGGGDELPSTWERRTLSSLCSKFEYGSSKKSETEGEVPVLRMGNMQNGEIDWNKLKYTSNPEEIEKYSLHPNTVLFNRTNSPELVGKTVIYRGDRPATFAGYLIRIHHGADLDPEYLNYCLNATEFREYCSLVKTDGVSQSNINAKKLAAYEMPWCELDEQQEIVRRVNALFEIAHQIEQRISTGTNRTEQITQSILAKAFAGELVETEADLAHREARDYEPASVLLERIAADRTAATNGKPKRAKNTKPKQPLKTRKAVR